MAPAATAQPETLGLTHSQAKLPAKRQDQLLEILREVS
jgi:hypothetical protein